MASGSKQKPVKLTPEDTLKIQESVFALLEPVIKNKLAVPYDLVDVALEKEQGHWFLRVYAENPENSLSINDCEVISRAIDPLLEESPVLADFSYNLEVSSPGLFRQLKTPREFEYFKGQEVKVTLANSSLNETGLLDRYDPHTQEVLIKNGDSLVPISLKDPDVSICLNPEITMPE